MTRSDARSTRLRRRPSRTIPATIVAVVLLAVGALAAVGGVWRLVNGRWPTQLTSAARATTQLSWGSDVVIGIGVGALVVGLVLLLAAIVPGGYKSAQLQAAGPGAAASTDFVISNRGLARLAAASADAVDGVDRVSASATGRKVQVQVSTTSKEQADLIRDRVRSAVTDTLASAGVQPAPQVSVAVQTKEI